MFDYFNLQQEEYGKKAVKTRCLDEYFCHCKKQPAAKDYDMIRSSDATEVDEEGICIYCGHYAFHKIYGVHV